MGRADSHVTIDPTVTSSAVQRNDTGVAAQPTMLLLGHPPSVSADCRDMCVAERWRLVECSTLEQMWALIETGEGWFVVLPETWEDIPIDDICERLLAHPMRPYIVVIGFLVFGDAATHADAIRAGIDVCLSYGSGIEALRTELRRLLPLATEMRRVRAGRSARRAAPYLGPRRRDSDVIENR